MFFLSMTFYSSIHTDRAVVVGDGDHIFNALPIISEVFVDKKRAHRSISIVMRRCGARVLSSPSLHWLEHVVGSPLLIFRIVPFFTLLPSSLWRDYVMVRWHRCVFLFFYILLLPYIYVITFSSFTPSPEHYWSKRTV